MTILQTLFRANVSHGSGEGSRNRVSGSLKCIRVRAAIKTASKESAVILAIVVVLCAGVLTVDAAVFKREYKMQVTVGPTTFWGMGATKFAELAEQKTGGRIRVKPYFGSQLLKGAQLNSSQMVALGAIDLAFESTINTAPVVTEMNVFSLPFFVNTFENVDRMESGRTGRMLFQAMERKGLMPLAWGENGFRQITNSKRAIRKPSDLARLRIRVVGSPIFVDIFRNFGADPINMNWGDAVTAFQQGTVDGQENPIGILLPVQIYQYHDYVTMWNYLIDPLVLYWSKRQWDRFPADVQDALRDAAREAARFQKALVRVGLDDGEALRILREEFDFEPKIVEPLRYLESKGMTVTRLSEEEKTAFKQAASPVTERWIQKIGRDIYEAAVKDMQAP